MKQLVILLAVTAFGVLGFVGPASATGALPLADNQTILKLIDCESTGTEGEILMHVDAVRRGKGPKLPVPQFDCIENEVQSHSPGGGAPATDGLGGGTEKVCDNANTDSLPHSYTVQALCGSVPLDANTIGVEGSLHIQVQTGPSEFEGRELFFHCNIENTCP